MRCLYCMPKHVQWLPMNELLVYDELVRLAAILSSLGIERIRITGGEPLARPGIENLISGIAKIREIKSIGMTTNGLLLAEKVEQLVESGLQSVNISLDTLNAEKFKAMGGVYGVDRVLAAIHAAIDAGLKVKINTVVIKGWNDAEIADLVALAGETGCTVRFIEFMPLDGAGIWSPDLVVSKKEILDVIRKAVNELVPIRNNGADPNNSDPAMLYSFADGSVRGTIGFIASITEPFCGNCDRLRITSDGRFLTCLFENPGYDLKDLLRSGAADQDLAEYMINCVKKKPEGVVSIIQTNGLKPTLNMMHKIGG